MKQTFNRRFPRKYNSWNNNNWNKKNNIYSAGILPYGKDSKGNVYFLLGKDRQMAWSDFGGSSHKGEKPFKTAIREGTEELNGFFGTEEEIEEEINSSMVL